jgi:hypothetical protein
MRSDVRETSQHLDASNKALTDIRNGKFDALSASLDQIDSHMVRAERRLDDSP